MEKDQAVQNQKVFVQLRDMVNLIQHYNFVCERFAASTLGTPSSDLLRNSKNTLEAVFTMLSLPIEPRSVQPKSNG